MGATVEVIDNSAVVKGDIKKATELALTAIGLQAGTDVSLLAPVDTGALKNSFSSRLISEDTVEVGTAIDYSIYQEFGTIYMTAANGGTGYFRRGIKENLSKYQKIVESIFAQFST